MAKWHSQILQEKWCINDKLRWQQSIINWIFSRRHFRHWRNHSVRRRTQRQSVCRSWRSYRWRKEKNLLFSLDRFFLHFLLFFNFYFVFFLILFLEDSLGVSGGMNSPIDIIFVYQSVAVSVRFANELSRGEGHFQWICWEVDRAQHELRAHGVHQLIGSSVQVHSRKIIPAAHQIPKPVHLFS